MDEWVVLVWICMETTLMVIHSKFVLIGSFYSLIGTSTLTEITIIAVIELRNRPLNAATWTGRIRCSIKFIFSLNKFNFPWW